MAVSNYATQGKDIGVADTTLPVNAQAVQGFADVLGTAKDFLNTKTVKGFGQQERAQYENYVDYSKEAGLMQEGIRLQGEAQNRTLTAEEQARVTEFENMAKMDEEAYKQGIRNRNDYQLSAQRRLRAAIQARPDLAEEFRRTSVKEIGTDVSTYALQYYWENLDAAGKALEKKPVSLTDIENQAQMVDAYIKTLPAEQQAEYANTTKRELAIRLARNDLQGASEALRGWSEKAAGSPVADNVADVLSMTASIMSDGDSLNAEISKLSDAKTRAQLFSDPALAEQARQKFMKLRQGMADKAMALSSYSSSSVFNERASAAITRANADIARIDAAFPDLGTKGLQEGSNVYIAAQMANLSPQIIGRARVAGLSGVGVSKEAVEAGMFTLGLGEKSMKGQPITKVEALQSPLQNYNMLITGLATSVADNETDAKKNYGMYAITYVSATLPYVSNLAQGPNKPATEVRAVSDYTDSLDGVLAVNNRNDSFLDGIWNAAAEKGDVETHNIINRARFEALNGYSQSVYMEITQLDPELAQYIRPRNFKASASREGGLVSATPVVVVNAPNEQTKKEAERLIARYYENGSAYKNFYDKTVSYFGARGRAVGDEGTGFFGGSK
jgi:hypothetical protein